MSDPIFTRQLEAMAFLIVGLCLVGLALYLRLRVFIGTRPGERVKPVGTFDVNFGYKITPATTVNLIVLNLADKKPSWDSSFAFFDYTQSDPRGRFASVKLTHKF